MTFLWFLSDLRTPTGDFFFQQITYLGQEIFVVAVICWLYWCVSKKSAYILGFSYFLSGLLIQALKITFRVPRPWTLPSRLWNPHCLKRRAILSPAVIPRALPLSSQRWLSLPEKNGRPSCAS